MNFIITKVKSLFISWAIFTCNVETQNIQTKSVWKDIDLPNGDRYIGMTNNEQKHGFGTYYFNNGDVFKGSFVKNVLQGEGLLIYSINSGQSDNTCNVYLGDFHKDTLAGIAEIIYDESTVYQGEFKENKYHHYGVYKNLDSQMKYQGLFSNDKKNGLALFYDHKYERFYGNFLNNYILGKGKLISSNGEIYQGHFKDSMKDGEGELIYPDKTKYVGQFKKDKKHGEGIFTSTKGTKFKEIWHLGVRKSRSKLF